MVYALVGAIGMAIGYVIGRRNAECGMRNAESDILHDFNRNIPNGRRGEIVNICGAEFVRMN